ncbi:secreted antigen 3 [Babesia divergens]|uniref:Secreted antigen 3 n=1 Tax=Babesia divergens TaxID=32595 RepID=A0AAD9GBH7_BABDI|nr:secreted antigen 3 [Babesia divergens]
MEGLVKRGFYDVKSNLQSNRGSTIASYMQPLVTHENPNGTSAGALQKALSYLLFSCPWDDALTGHAICFLSTFCSKVNNNLEAQVKEKFKGNSEYFKNICNSLVPHLNPFVTGSGFDSDSDSHLRAVSHGGATLFDNIWDDGKFDKYCDWLKENLHHIIQSLKDMSTDCKNWDSDKLQGANTPGPFKYGFVFKDNNWQDYVTKGNLPKAITSLTASLKNLLADLLFVFPWDPSLLGHALCFLYKFCSKVQDGSLEGKLKGYSGDLKTVCHDLQNHLQYFVNGSGTYIRAVCKSNTTLFDGIWDDEHFDKYCDWLRKNLKNIIAALKAMSSDCKQWTKEKLKEASSAGPSRFGFVFKDDSWNDQTFKTQLPSKISPLTAPAENSGSLKKLKECLEPSSSTAAAAAGAAGGLFGLGGAGAGAAYGLNLFGFKNLVTSLISGFLK